MIAVAILAWKYYRHVPFITWVATATVPLVGFQGLLGAITVVRELPPEVVATHLVTAMVVLSCTVAVTIAMYREDPARQFPAAAPANAAPIGRWAMAAIAWLAVTFWIGAYMAESGAATACSGWPLCNGGVLPAAEDQEITHMAHRYLAGGFTLIVVPLFVAAWKRRDRVAWARPFAAALGFLYGAQILIGALNVWYTFPDELTVTHTVIAASIWFTVSGAVALTYYVPAGEPRARSLANAAGAPA